MKLNGNLVLNAGGQSEIQNAVLERVTGLPAVLAAEAGRILYNITDGKYYYNTGSTWMAFATGGNATALQTEVDALESALGAMVNGDGSFAATAFAGFNNVASPTSVLNALNQLDAAIAGKDSLAELKDVSIAGRVAGDYLKFNGTVWAADALTLADVTNVTATATEVNQLAGSGVVTADLTKLHAVTADAAELNKLHGATVTTSEINALAGVDTVQTIQTQLDNKQPIDDQLTSIAGLTIAAGDVLVGKANGTFEALSGAGFRSSQGLVIGTDVQAFDPDLAQLAAFAPAANDFIVATGGGEGSRYALKRGADARTALGLGDIATMDDSEFIKSNGTSTVTADIPLNGFQITGLGTPTTSANAATKGYVDQYLAGLSWKNSVAAATTGNITLSGLQTIDGVAITAGARVLVKNQTAASENGIYVAAAGAWSRAADMDQVTPLNEVNSAAVFVQSGTTQADTGWTQINDVTTLGTDPVQFTQFNGAAGIDAGIGLSKNGNTLNVNLGAGIKELGTDAVGIDLYNVTTGALILTTNGSARGTGDNTQLHLLTRQTQLEQDANGLYIVPAGVTETELAASVAGDGLVGGNGSAIAVASAAGAAGSVGTLVIDANSVGVALGSTSTTAAPGNHVHSASVVTFDNRTAGLVGDPANVQAAIQALDAAIDSIGSGNIPTLQSEIDAIEAAVGLGALGAFTPYTGTNYVSGATTVKGAVTALDTALKTEETARIAVNTRLTSSYYVYTGSAATSHTITHTCGVKYCNVTVVDGTDEVIIPQSIKFNSVGNLTVTFNTAVACKVIIMGVA